MNLWIFQRFIFPSLIFLSLLFLRYFFLSFFLLYLSRFQKHHLIFLTSLSSSKIGSSSQITLVFFSALQKSIFHLTTKANLICGHLSLRLSSSLLFFLFSLFQMRPSGAHLYKRVCPSICPSVRRSVGPLRLCKNPVSRLFLTTVRSYTETNDQPTCFECLLYYSVVLPVCLSICLSIYVT